MAVENVDAALCLKGGILYLQGKKKLSTTSPEIGKSGVIPGDFLSTVKWSQ